MRAVVVNVRGVDTLGTVWSHVLIRRLQTTNFVQQAQFDVFRVAPQALNRLLVVYITSRLRRHHRVSIWIWIGDEIWMSRREMSGRGDDI